MKVSVKNGKGCEKILKIEVDSQKVKDEFDIFYKNIAPKAKVPGFRPGKAPQSVLVMHYHDEARKNVLDHLINDSYRSALKTEELEPLGYPQIHDVDFADDKLVYQAQIEVRPKIKLGKVEGLQAKKETAVVKPEEMQESLKRVQKSQAQYKSVDDRGAQKNDFVVAEYVCLADGKEIDKRVEDWIQIREDEYLKGFSGQLIGLKAGDEKEIKVTLPENFYQKEHAKKEALFQVKIKEVKEEILPELTDELAKSVGEYESLQALKDKIQRELQEAKDRDAEAAYEKALLDELMKHNKITLPEGVVAKRLERLVSDAQGHYHRHGFPKEKLDEMEKDLRKDLEEEARRQVHVAFLLDEIAQKFSLNPSEEDFKKHYERISVQVHQSAEVVEKYYTENEDARVSLNEQIRSEKAVQYIKDHAKQK